jgi:acyl-CoA-dependent ceramide synthase
VLLGGLQLLNLYWGFLILRVAWRFGVKGELADERSEDEDEGEVVEMLPEAGVLAAEVDVRREVKREGAGMRRGAMPKRRAR